jgi:hypothetical protein
MEAARHAVDGWVLDQLATRTFARSDFAELRDGTCRLMPPLARAVAEAAPRWATAVAPVAEAVVAALAGRSVATPLTGANRRAAKGGQDDSCSANSDALPPACRGCGIVLDRPGLAWCDGCRPGRLAEVGAALGEVGPAALARLRAEGADPSHGSEAGQSRGKRNAAHYAANREWATAADEESVDFVRDVLPAV